MTGTLTQLCAALPHAAGPLTRAAEAIIAAGEPTHSRTVAAFAPAGAVLVPHVYCLTADPETLTWHRIYGDPVRFSCEDDQ